MNVEDLRSVFVCISRKIEENKEYLIKLDQINGDGDLGISMSDGFRTVNMLAEVSEETDLGKMLIKSGAAFNEAAPSSLGTILSFGLMGMGKSLKGVTEASLEQMAEALFKGTERIMEKAGSRPGERTILDSLCPAAEAFGKAVKENRSREEALQEAARAAGLGAEATRNMKPVHGRAAYYGEKSLGHLDGGAVVGQLIFEALSACGW